MVKKIQFSATNEFIPLPKPASHYVPKWYKDADRFLGGASAPVIDPNNENKGLKLCTPLLDGLTSGYVAELWQDLQVTQENGEPSFSWPTHPPVLTGRSPHAAHTLPTPAGHSDVHLVWLSPYIIKTPPGYSVLITHPLNRFDLPFTTLSAVVDSDGTMMDGKVPFFIQKDFEGIIPAGTPIFQIIPVKRDDWEKEETSELQGVAKKLQWLSGRVAYGFYKTNLWNKKTYQ